MTRWKVDRRCRSGIGRSHQVPRPFAGMTAYENVLVASACRAARTGAGTRRTARARRDSSVAGCSARPTGPRPRSPCWNASGWRWHGRWRPDPQVLLLDEIAGGLTDAETDELDRHHPAVARRRHRHRLDRARRSTRCCGWIDRLVCLAAGPDPGRGQTGRRHVPIPGRRGLPRERGMSLLRSRTSKYGTVCCAPSATSPSPWTRARSWRWSGPTAPESPRLMRAVAGSQPQPRARIGPGRRGHDGPAGPRPVAPGSRCVPEGRRLFADLTVEENLLVASGYAPRPMGPGGAVVAAFPLLDGLLKRRAPATCRAASSRPWPSAGH